MSNSKDSLYKITVLLYYFMCSGYMGGIQNFQMDGSKSQHLFTSIAPFPKSPTTLISEFNKFK